MIEFYIFFCDIRLLIERKIMSYNNGRKNIILTGMPGSGKSTTGRILAEKLGMDFVDTDCVIEECEGMRLQEIIDSKGPDVFMEIESDAVINLEKERCVIAPGGSVVLCEKAINHLKKDGVVVFLNVPQTTLKRRINIDSRGIVMKPGETLDHVWERRRDLYYKYADIVIDCEEMEFSEIAHKIIVELPNK